MHTQVLDDEIALLADANPLEMARGMCALLEDQALREKLSEAAQRRMYQHFSAQVLDSKLSDFYEELAMSLGRK